MWFTGKFTPRLVRRTVALGDGWMPYGVYGMTLADKAQAIVTLRDAFARAGRSPDELEVADALPVVQASIERTMEQLPALAEAGITIARVPLRRIIGGPDEIERAIEQVGLLRRQVA